MTWIETQDLSHDVSDAVSRRLLRLSELLRGVAEERLATAQEAKH